MASPTWLGTMSSVAKRVLERMDAMIFETDDQGRPGPGSVLHRDRRGPRLVGVHR
jgi:multimeric flavodoxin WrbA